MKAIADKALQLGYSQVLVKMSMNLCYWVVQALSHSYVTFFDNVSERKDFTSDKLCRAVTGSGFVKRGLYTDDEDRRYNMKSHVEQSDIMASMSLQLGLIY